VYEGSPLFDDDRFCRRTPCAGEALCGKHRLLITGPGTWFWQRWWRRLVQPCQPALDTCSYKHLTSVNYIPDPEPEEEEPQRKRVK
jgi:hypothetical protein